MFCFCPYRNDVYVLLCSPLRWNKYFVVIRYRLLYLSFVMTPFRTRTYTRRSFSITRSFVSSFDINIKQCTQRMLHSNQVSLIEVRASLNELFRALQIIFFIFLREKEILRPGFSNTITPTHRNLMIILRSAQTGRSESQSRYYPNCFERGSSALLIRNSSMSWVHL